MLPDAGELNSLKMRYKILLKKPYIKKNPVKFPIYNSFFNHYINFEILYIKFHLKSLYEIPFKNTL